MKSLVLTGAAAAALSISACGGGGSAAANSSSSAASSSRSPGASQNRGGAAGELVKLDGSSSLVLNTQSGDVTVTFSSRTPVRRTRTGSVADIVTGSCIVAGGQKDGSGALTIATVNLSSKVGGSCQSGSGRPGGDLGSPGPGGQPQASPSGTPRGVPANVGAVRGEVTAVKGTSVTVQPATGNPTTITIPTTVRVSVAVAATTADLAVGDCVLATGKKDASGTVAARSLAIQPAGPSGCFTGGGGRGFGRGNGGGFGGGGNGGGNASPGAGAGA